MPISPNRRYPPHLWTLEFNLGPALPTLSHHYPTETDARADFRTAQRVMNVSPQAIQGLRLYHRHELKASATPTPTPGPTKRALPAPGPDGITRLPALARELRPLSSRFFNSVDLPVMVEDPSSLPI